ncbi:MAG TPA: DUF5017 domain-containing protein [Niastella sp.]|nr:DUF5017 domain-containing protein [Niastella sp.]
MVHKIIYSFVVLTALLSACSKQLSRGDNTFEVTAEKTTVNKGDTVRFSFSGDPDMISFYSGETGKRFNYINRASADGTPLLRFRSLRANGSQPNSLTLFVSGDFEGVAIGDTNATINRIGAATWTDITSRATLSTGALTSSGNINLLDFANASKPVYVAFRYTAQPGSVQNKWTIDSFSIKNVLADGTNYEIANHNASTVAYSSYGVQTYSPGFVNYRVNNNFNWIIGSTSLVITGADSAPWAIAVAEAWAIVGPVDLKKVTPDVGAVIKTTAQSIADVQFSYRYTTPGTYEATFYGGRVSLNENEQEAKSITITVQ